MKVKKVHSFLVITSLFLLCSCSLRDIAKVIDPNLTVPTLDLPPTPQIETVFKVPNKGNGIERNEFFDSYSDYDDTTYVLKNIIDTEDADVNALTEVYEMFERNDVHSSNDFSGRYKDYNIINILSETLELRFAHPTLTPTLWKLMEHSMYFENFYVSEYQEGATCNSEFISLSGLLPIYQSTWGANMCSTSSRDNYYKYALPAQLKANNYDTYYFHSGHAKFYNRDTFMDKLGFEPYGTGNDTRFLEDLGIEDTNKYIADEEAVQFFEQFIDYEKYASGENNFSVNFLTYSMHGGYSSSSLAVKENIDDVIPALGVPSNYFNGNKEVLYYLAKLRSFDKMLEKLLDLLNKANVADNTIITLYRDHHPYLMNDTQYIWYLNENLEEDIEKTSINRFKQPLIIADLSNLEKEKEIITQAGSMEDLVPTLLNLLGVEANYRHFHGSDILSGKTLAFLSPQGDSNTTALVTDGQGTIFELTKEFIGDESKSNEYALYLYNKLTQLQNMITISTKNYFSYYYYYLPFGTWINGDDTIFVTKENIYFNGNPVDNYYYTADYTIQFAYDYYLYKLSFSSKSNLLEGTYKIGNEIFNCEFIYNEIE